MGRRTTYTPGTPCWVDVFTPDPAAAQRFYGAVFGWTAGEAVGEDYGFLRRDGAVAAGLGRLTEEQAQRGMPPSWSMYVRVEDADVTAARAAELGGTVAVAPFTVDGVGRIAVVHDAQDAVFLLLEPAGFDGAEVVNEAGAWAWNDLVTLDPAAAAPFYAELFGWSIDAVEGSGGAYWAIGHEGRTIGGVMQAQPPVEHQYWTVYLGTDAMERSLELVVQHGGRHLVGPISVPAGRFAVALDPQGAQFCLVDGRFDA
jgi:predicted enzyme related to lactoylglutathione lyase